MKYALILLVLSLVGCNSEDDVNVPTIYIDEPVALIHITHFAAKPDDRTILFSLYDNRLHITCGKNVDMDKAAEIFFNEILQPMVDMYIEKKLNPNSFMIIRKP